ncbi:hypothetical protein D3C72_2228460 [compost metagenome]
MGAGGIAMAVGQFAGVGVGFLQPAREAGQVSAVGGQRVGGQAVLQPDGVNEGVDIGLGGERRAGDGHGAILRPGATAQRSPTPAAADFNQFSNSLRASERSLRCG